MSESQEHPALRLAVAISRLRARLREEGRASLSGFSLSQIAVVKRLRREERATAASLAASEHVTQQAIAQTIAGLKRRGYVQTEPDTTDRRKTLVSLTPEGRALVESILATRDAWLVRAIDAAVPTEQWGELERTVEFLERLADVHLGPETDIR